MTITTVDGLVDALGNNSSRFLIDKASLSNAVAGQFYSLWRATGQPGQGAIPTTAATCDNTLTGCVGFTQQTPPATSYMAILESMAANTTMTLEIHDRIMHMGGLSGTSIVSQTVGLDVHANIASDNITDRIGDSNYSDISWWMEWYSDTGATASNATINVTYDDATSGDLTVVAVGGTLRAGRMILLNGLIPAAASGKYIRDINTVILSASTTAAGNFGFTATRFRAANFMPLSNSRYTADWAGLGLPQIYNESCLFPIVMCSTTTTGIIRAAGKIVHG
jgi:hypothetical protein